MPSRDLQLSEVASVGGLVLEKDVEAVEAVEARVQLLSGRVVGVAEEGIRCLLFADLIEIPQQALDAPPVPPDYGTGNLVAEDEP